MSEMTVESETVEAALKRAGWTLPSGKGLYDGIAWVVDQYTELRDEHRDLEKEFDKARNWLGARIEDVHALRAKFQNEQKARLRTADELNSLRRHYTELESKFYDGWRAERDRLQAEIDVLETGSRRLADALSAISDSSGRYKTKYTARRHEWCVKRAARALKEWMPCEDCCVSGCEFAFHPGNRGRVEGHDCLKVSDEDAG